MKFIKPTIALIILIAIGYALYSIDKHIQAVESGTIGYIEANNRTLEVIICKQQVPGTWDLSKCPQ
jgi:hypothetical protein